MPGRPPKVDHVREAFLASTDSAETLVDSVLRVGGINPSSACPRLHAEHARRVVGLAFLGMIASWEEFLEQVFVRYMRGATSESGFSPSLRMGRAVDLAHAYHVLSGDPEYDSTKHYSRFGDPKWVIASSKLYFEQGAPFAARLSAKLDPLQHAIRIRNRVAHASTKVKSDFKVSAKVHLGLAAAAPLTRGYGVGDLLVSPAQRLFGQQARDRGLNYFGAYKAMYRALAKGIVP